MSENYYYISIKTYPSNEPVLRTFYNVTDLKVTEKIKNAPAFNVNEFYFISEDNKKLQIEIQGEIIEKVRE